MIIALDLSLSSTGYAIFKQDGKLIEKGTIVPDKELPLCFKVNYLVRQLSLRFRKPKQVVIEDTYLGITGVRNLKELNRLAGAVVNEWIMLKYIEPKWYAASTARAIVGLKGNCQKAEVQVFILKNYSKVGQSKISKYEKAIQVLRDKYDTSKIVLKDKRKRKKEMKKIRGKLKYRMEKLSSVIEDETGYGNDLSDAIVIGRAYIMDCRRKK